MRAGKARPGKREVMPKLALPFVGSAPKLRSKSAQQKRTKKRELPAIDFFFEFFADLEKRQLFFRDVDDFAGAGVATLVGLVITVHE